uniref:Uncharacterized protein n=1 Tax=Nelumbo nucifera TaxID=4432 RepID=A0A822ZRW2_NELNU|nr:TPA_asm: hypothetical protein HUJ06_004521 [Nelumbo nucifera]
MEEGNNADAGEITVDACRYEVNEDPCTNTEDNNDDLCNELADSTVRVLQ